mgnify:CR=1 FL=1
MNKLSKRSPVLSGVLSLFLGPFGYIYVGLNFFFAALLISILFSVVLLVINLPFPHFFNYLQLFVYAYFGYKLANIRNVFADDWGVSEEDIKEFKSFGFAFVLMTNLLMALTQFYSIAVGLFLAYKSFANGKILIGILILVFGIGLLMWLLSSIFSFISGILMMIFKVDKKYF